MDLPLRTPPNGKPPAVGVDDNSFNSASSLSGSVKILSITPNSKSSPRFERQSSIISSNIAEVEETISCSLSTPGSLSQRIVFLGNRGRKLISPLHDIPIHGPDGLLICVCKTPAGHWLRYEAAVDEPFNPLRPVQKDSALKFALDNRRESNSSPWQKVRKVIAQSVRHDHYADNAPWNVGLLPQTHTSNSSSASSLVSLSDGAMEVVDIGAEKLRKTGDLYCVKPLGAFSLESRTGEKVLKVVSISADDSMAPLMNDLTDVASYLPGLTDLVSEWLLTCTVGTKGSREPVRIVGPLSLAATQSAIADGHRSWFRFKEGAMVQSPLSLKKGRQFSVEELEATWSQYTTREDSSIFRDVLSGVACPTSETSIFFQEAWIAQEDDKKGSNASSSGSELLSLVSPVSVLRPKAAGSVVLTSPRTKAADRALTGIVSVAGRAPAPAPAPGNASPARSDISAKSAISASSAGESKHSDSSRRSRQLLGSFSGALSVKGDSAQKSVQTDKEEGKQKQGLFGFSKSKAKADKAEEKVVPLGVKALRHMTHRQNR